MVFKPQFLNNKVPGPSGERNIHSSKLTWKWRGAYYETTILYIGPSMSFHVNSGEGTSNHTGVLIVISGIILNWGLLGALGAETKASKGHESRITWKTPASTPSIWSHFVLIGAAFGYDGAFLWASWRCK